MERTKISDILPIGALMPLLIVLGIELLFSYGLAYYNNFQENQIQEKTQNLTQKENEILNKIKTNEGYFVFSQYANIAELAQRRYSVNQIIEKFNKLMPKFLIVKSFAYDDEKKEINLKLSTVNWDDYLKFVDYLEKNPNFKIIENPSPKYNTQSQLIDFTLQIQLTPNFFK
ncbi:MAG: hypothetical protein C4348_00475 [Patescibacteria group bacterium]